MNILNNEGHDPNGLGNRRARSENEVRYDNAALAEENALLRAALDPFARHAHCTDEIQPSSLALWCAQALNALAAAKR